eukprot:SAG11_NODE_12976_length_676_cov_0.972270_2_plen_46_part_01
MRAPLSAAVGGGRRVEADEVLEPRAGRLVMFTSGAEHLHQARPVEH